MHFLEGGKTSFGPSVVSGTAAGNMMYCDVKDVSYALMIRRGSTADQYSFLSWPPYTAALAEAILSLWVISLHEMARITIKN